MLIDLGCRIFSHFMDPADEVLSQHMALNLFRRVNKASLPLQGGTGDLPSPSQGEGWGGVAHFAKAPQSDAQ